MFNVHFQEVMAKKWTGPGSFIHFTSFCCSHLGRLGRVRSGQFS